MSLEGLTLTTAVSELTARQLVSGTARFAGALTTLLKLTFGAVAAAQLVNLLGWRPMPNAGEVLPEWMPWLTLLAGSFAAGSVEEVIRRDAPPDRYRNRLLTDAAHAAGAIAMVDACQFVPHNLTDVGALGADLMAFSSHKMCGPTGIGVLWGREAILDAMPPFLGGGNMITDVRFDGFTAAGLPDKFEAGTPPIIEAVGLGAAIDYVTALGMNAIRQHEMTLTRYALDTLNERFGDDITIHGPDNVEKRGAVLSFAFRDVHPHDVSQILDESNVCIRAGHHCAKPLMRAIGAGATARASFYVYNDEADVDALADALSGVSDVFGL